jgi:ribosomal protein S18 acetylase RimI-like enzyme
VIREIKGSTGFFYPEEIDTAVELAEERLARGERSGYWFVFADEPQTSSGAAGWAAGTTAAVERTVGYACFGRIACTKASYDLYWIAVHADRRGTGLGTLLLEESERRIRAKGGHRIYVETSSRELYEPTRSFYLARGYREEARLDGFYGPGDAKVIYVKEI